MQALLRDYTLLGVTTNRQFLLAILTSVAFADGATDTDFLHRHFSGWQPDTTLSEQLLAIAALGDLLQRHGQGLASPATALTGAGFVTPWQRYDHWRLGGTR
jgi:acetyl/propionyl-CoA carboxylase alpha subunit